MSLMSSLTDLIEDNSAWNTAMGQRLVPVIAPQNMAGPWCVFSLTEEPRDYALSGVPEYLMAEVRFKILSDDYYEAHEIVKLLYSAIDRYKGATGDIIVFDIHIIDSRDSETKDEVLDLFSVICDVSVWYKHA